MVGHLRSQWQLGICQFFAVQVHAPLTFPTFTRFLLALLTLALFPLALLSLPFLALTTAQHVNAQSTTSSITLTADSKSIYLGDTLVVEMEAVGLEGSVDIAPLFKSAELLRESQGTRIAVIDQRVVEVKIRRMEFLPRQEGQLLMGPLQGDSLAGGVSSNTLKVNVLPTIDEQWQPDSTDLQMSLTLTDGISNHPVSDNETPYVTYIGQHIIADIKLRHRHPIVDEELVLPAFDGFDVLAGHEQRRTIEADASPDAVPVDSGEQADKAEADRSSNTDSSAITSPVETDPSSSADSWRVIAWRYHLFAQRSGELTIGKVSWRGIVIRSRTQRAEFVKQVPARSVKIKPAADDAQWWLPASALSLEDSWSSDALELSAGDEVIRTITLEARDVLASHLPEVYPLQSRALSSTLIDQSRSQQLVGDHIQASAIYKFRMLAESPIPVFLDTVRVGWYDTTQSELREAIIPARRINVGLPERDDLLAALALNDKWTDRLALEVRSVASSFAYWHVSLIVLGLIACLMVGREIWIVLNDRFHPGSKNDKKNVPNL